MVSFIFGGDTPYRTPQELARARAFAQALAGNQRAPKDVGEGLNAIGQALMYRALTGKADKSEAAQEASRKATVGRIFDALNAKSVPFPSAPPEPGSEGAASFNTGMPSSGAGGNYRDAIASIESDGNGGYSAIGPTHPKYGRALGRYQVMEANLGPWSEKYLGRRVTPDEFLANPAMQDAIFDGEFGNYVQKYGNPQDAASMWFTGLPASEGANKRDVLGTTGSAYVDKFNQALGSNSPASPVQVASLGPVALPGGDDPYSLIPATDSRGEDQRAKFRQWNSNPQANEGDNLGAIDPGLRRVIERAKQIAGTDFVLGSGRRDADMQKKAKEWGWSKTDESDHLGGWAADLWPVDGQGRVVFDPQKQAQIAAAMKQAAGELGTDLDVGADWKGFRDMPHFAMRTQLPFENIPTPMPRPDMPQQVASLDQSIGLPPNVTMATPRSAAPNQQFQVGGPAATSPQAQRYMAQALNPTSMGAGNGMMPPAQPPMPQQAPAPAPGPQGVPLPEMAGNNPTIPNGPSLVQLYQALQNPALTDSDRAMIGGLIAQQQQAADPAHQLDMDYKRAQIDALRNPVEKPTDDMREYDFARQQGYQGTFQQFMTDMKKAGATNVSVGAERGYDKTVGEGYAKRFLTMQDDAQAAQRTLNGLQVMENAMQDPTFYSGSGEAYVNSLKRLGASVGINPDSVSSVETFNALAKQAALDSMGGSLGTGFSNADRDFVTEQVPSLSNTPAGNAKLIEIQRKLNQRKLEIAGLARQYAAQHDGRIDTGFDGYVSRWAEQNPLFPKVEQGALPNGVTEEDIQHTMQLHGISREEVLRRIGGQ